MVAADSYFIPEKHFPFESKFLDYKGFKLHYIDEGTGPVVFLLHGNPTWCFFYRNLIQHLKKFHRVIAIDYVGCGLSDHPTTAHFRAADRVAEVEFVYQSLQIDSFSIVMHDWGGAIGTRFLQSHLDKVEKVIYLNTTLTEVESLPRMIKMSAHPLSGVFLTKIFPQFLRYLTGPGSVKKLPRWVKEGYFYPYQTIARRTAIWDFVSDIPFTEDHPTYVEMQNLARGFAAMQHVPIKIIWGLKDPCFHPYMLRKVAAHFPKAEVVEIPDAGHLVLEDSPEFVCSEIEKFLSLEGDMNREFAEAFSPFTPRPGINALYASFMKASATVANEAAVIIPQFIGSVTRYQQLSFRELQARINQYARGLSELGLQPGDRALMLLPPGDDFLALSYAVMLLGAVPAFVDPGVGREKLFKCIKDCDPHVLIGAPKAHLLRLRGKKLFPNLKFSIWATEFHAFGGTSLGFLKRFSAGEVAPVESPQGVSMIAFTSGATGTPKGVIFSNENIEHQLEIFSKYFGIVAGEKDLPLLPIFAVFSCAMGVTSVFPPMNPSKPLELDPEKVVRIIQDLGIQTSFGSPTLWDKISDYCVRHSEPLNSIKKVLMAGAPVSDEVLERVQKILPSGKALTPYGATECLPVTAVRGDDVASLRGVLSHAQEEGTPVGAPVDHTKVAIIQPVSGAIKNIADAEQCPPFVIGEVIIQGPQVSPAYINRVDANLLGKIKDGETFWHRIGDVGYLDDKGNLFYCGRKAHVVTTPEQTYYPDPVENIFNRHPLVRRTALVSPGKGNVGLAIEPKPGNFPKTSEQREKLFAELRELGQQSPATQRITDFYLFEAFPVDARHNAKIFRDLLSQMIQEQQYERAA